jgi:hypothetical protein
LIQIPEEYSSTNFNTKPITSAEKLCSHLTTEMGKSLSSILNLVESSVGKFTSASGLPYNTALLNVADIIKVKAGMYFQIVTDGYLPPIKLIRVSDMNLKV